MKNFKICFVIPNYGISGGIHVIFRHSEFLSKKGYDVYIASLEKPLNVSWYPSILDLVTTITFLEAPSFDFDVVCATSWETVYSLRYFHSKKYAYLVQAPEYLFIPAENKLKSYLAEATYVSGIEIITIAKWMKEMLKTRYGVNSYFLNNGVIKHQARVLTNELDSYTSVKFLVEGSITDDRKFVWKTVSILHQMGVSEIYLLTSSKIKRFPFVKKVYSQIPINATQEVYRSCDVLVKLSTVEGMFGPPLEMFVSGGTAITFNVPGYEEYILHGYNALVAEMYDYEQVKCYIKKIIHDRKLLLKLQSNAVSTAKKWCTWEDSSSNFENIINEVLTSDSDGTFLTLKRLDIFYKIYSSAIKNPLYLFKVLYIGIIRKIFNKVKVFIFNF